jgi:DNA-binding FadR family transcriptional regulator
LEDAVVAAGWPVGQVLGSEGELLQRFGVSRSVFREAVRIVEHTGAARMRRGPGGGLVVTRPNREALVAAFNVWFSFIGATMSEMLDVRAPLLVAVVRRASERTTPAATAALRRVTEEVTCREEVDLGDLARIEDQLAVMTTNPSLALCSATLADLTTSRLRGGWAEIVPPLSPQELAAQRAGYVALSRAAAEGRPDDAEAEATALLARVESRLMDMRQRRPRRWVHSRSDKLAEQVAVALRDDIERAGWPVGTVLGSESELVQRHGVSRAILREAVRILEHHGAVQTKRGPRGGLMVTAPDVTAIRRASRLYLEYEGVSPEGLSETRTVVEVTMARLAAERVTPASAMTLRDALDAERGMDQVATRFSDIHTALADASGNRLLSLFVEMLAELVPARLHLEQREAEQQAEISSLVHRAHERIVGAVVAGDAEQAGRRMRRHLQASAGVLR